MAVASGWPLDALLYRSGPLSGWAQELLAGAVPGARVELPPALLGELGGRDDGPPEIVAVASMPADDLARVGPEADLVVIGDRTSSPGNLGTIVRTADALGADGVIVVGHAADPYDPQAVRASRGSLFALPVVRAESPAPVLEWLRQRPTPLRVVGASEAATVPVWAHDWRAPTAVVIGNETTGMSRGWTAECDEVVAIPQTGAATSLNAAVSAAIVLYEVRRQRAG
jgi:23S rRNA (uridine2479-2'-O)-methyltransferase